MVNTIRPEDEFPFETDSVDAQFGGEYSEDTLNMVKSHGNKPTWMEEPSVRIMQLSNSCFLLCHAKLLTFYIPVSYSTLNFMISSSW